MGLTQHWRLRGTFCMPQLIARDETKEIKKFADVMNRLERAKTPDEYGRLVALVHDEVDSLEKVFKNETPRNKTQGSAKDRAPSHQPQMPL